MPTSPVGAASNRYFLYFAGLGTGPSGADGFIANAQQAGLDKDHVITHRCPYPTWSSDHHRVSKGISNAGRFLGSMKSYGELTDPHSPTAQAEFRQVLAELQARGVQPGDSVTLISHSAGGQEAATMALLLKEMSSYHVDTVVLMGAPVLKNNIPLDDRVVAAVNPSDPVTGDAGRVPGLHLNGIPAGLDRYPSHAVVHVTPDPDPKASQHGRYFTPSVLHDILRTAEK